MEIVKALFNAGDPDVILYFDIDGNADVRPYPPKTSADKALVKKLGGHYEISKATFRYNEELNKEIETFQKFRESKIHFTESYAINSLIANVLDKEDLMKLKLTIFDHDFVKNSKNREVLTNIRKSEDPIDLIMYFGMLRKEANDIS